LKKEEIKKGEIVIYKTSSGPRLEVRLEKETIWLDAHQIAKLFDVKRPAIVKHIHNIYESGELRENSTCSILEQVAADDRKRKMNFYNLDVIISVGYRVNSRRATQFRIWATEKLKEHLVQGYTINEKRLLSARVKFEELQETISFLQKKSKHELLTGQEQEILDLLANYAKTLTLLEQYDRDKLILIKKGRGKFILDYDNALEVIKKLQGELSAKKEVGDLFGQEYGEKFRAVLGNILQTFGGKELYPSIEEKAAHLLYFVIKDHPFADGNKRIGSFLFVYFLGRNGYLNRETGEKKINDNALVALALLIAVSDPKDKDIMIRIISNLLK